MSGEAAVRLRELQDRNGWAAADMAERAGIPKRTHKQVLRQGVGLPALEALCALSRGPGVSLDWLIFGEPAASETVELIGDRAAGHLVRLLAETLLRYRQEGRADLISNERVLLLSPEEWAADLGLRAAEKARAVPAEEATKEDLLRWRTNRTQRLTELLRERFGALAALHQSPARREMGTNRFP